MIKRFLVGMVMVLAGVMCAAPASAEKVYIDITSPGVGRLPIAIQQFVGAKDVSDVVKSDLDFTGLFDCVDDAAQIERPDQAFNSMNWKGIGVELVVKGTSSATGAVIVHAYDVSDGNEKLRKEYTAGANMKRQLAHMIANDIYKLLTGQNGIFRSKIAFVYERRKAKQLYIMDWDGERSRPLGPYGGIMLAPRWSYDGSKLIYSSEKKRRWGIYVYDFNTGTEANTNVPLSGLSVAGNFFPDNRRFLFSSSNRGNANISVGNVRGGRPHRLINSPWIDISPSVSPDGKSIVFVSNRTGGPQVYLADSSGYSVRRLTHAGSYNTSPAWSPSGDLIVYASMIGGRNQLFVIRPDGTGLTQLTKDGNNEDPSFSPDGRYIAFSSTRGGGKGIYIIRADGQNMRRISPRGYRAASPAWSPF
jgi:TolB protein